MNLKRTMLCLICAVALLSTSAGNPAIVQASADTQAQPRAKAGKDYKTLYSEFLAQGKINEASGSRVDLNWYYVLNINKSGVPELIVATDGGGMATYHIYTVSGKKVKECGECTTRGISNNPPTFDYVSKYKGIKTSGWTNFIGGVWANLFQVSKGKLVHKYHARSSETPKEYYTGTTDTKCKKVGQAAYNKYYKKYFSKAKTYKMIKNTADNRKKSFGK